MLQNSLKRDPAAKARPAASFALNIRKLENFLARTIAGYRGPTTARQIRMSGGIPTYLISSSSDRLVLRRKSLDPNAPPYDIEREFRVLAALHAAGYPVPRPLIYSDDAAVGGSVFYIMEHVDGRTFRDPVLPTLTGDRGALYDSMNGALARLHSFDPAVIGLQAMARSGNYLARFLERWSHIYNDHATEEIPEFNRLTLWLAGHLPPERPARLVHGDFRLNHMLFSYDAPELIAVIDWEHAMLGDPIADAVHHFMMWLTPKFGDVESLNGHDLAALGIPDLETYAQSYASRMSMIELPYPDTYFAFGCFRLAAMAQVHAAQTGLSADHARRMAQMGWHFAQSAGA